jgi:hypothetical protein
MDRETRELIRQMRDEMVREQFQNAGWNLNGKKVHEPYARAEDDLMKSFLGRLWSLPVAHLPFERLVPYSQPAHSYEHERGEDWRWWAVDRAERLWWMAVAGQVDEPSEPRYNVGITESPRREVFGYGEDSE